MKTLLVHVGLISLSLLSGSAGSASEKLPPLYRGLGRHHHPVTTQYEMAQRYFDQGLTLCFNFNHAEAIRSFVAATEIDPNCAMAWWGISYALGPNINMPMDAAAVPRAWESLQRAVALRNRVSEVERAYINALSARYTAEPPADRNALDRAYAYAMRELTVSFPNDADAKVLLAEALMDVQPWDYWTPERDAKPFGGEALNVLAAVLAASAKGHPGADHLMIHLTESGPNPMQGVPSADRLASYAPSAGHLVHMPSHTYVRVGRFHDAAEVNEDAIAADEKFLRATKASGVYAGGYYPHNLHLLWYATDVAGRSRDALKAARKVSGYTLDLRCGAIEGPRLRYLPVLAAVRFGRWQEVLNTQSPAPEYPFDRAMWHYARGVALAAQGKPAEASIELASLTELAESEAVKAMDNPYFPGTGILAVARAVLAGKSAAAAADADSAISELKRAVELEGKLPYMEPPFWYYSVRESLGASLLRFGRPEEAESVFRAELNHLPGNGWGYWGLQQSLRAQGREDAADVALRDYRRAWRRADVRLDLSWF